MQAQFFVEDGKLTIGEPSTKPGEWARVWNSQGEEITP